MFTRRLYQQPYSSSAVSASTVAISALRFCSSCSPASAASKEMKEFLSLLQLRGLCASSNNTRKAAVAAADSESAVASCATSGPASPPQPMMMAMSTADSRNVANTCAKPDEPVSTIVMMTCPSCKKRCSSSAALEKHVRLRHQQEEKNVDDSVPLLFSPPATRDSLVNRMTTIAERWGRLVTKQKRQARTTVASSKTQIVGYDNPTAMSVGSDSSSDQAQQKAESRQPEKINESSASVTDDQKSEASTEAKPTTISVESEQPAPTTAPTPATTATATPSAQPEPETVQLKPQNSKIVVTLSDQDRCDLLAAQIDLVNATTEALVSWAQRSEKRRNARSFENNSIVSPGSAATAAPPSPSAAATQSVSSMANPFFVSKKHPYGGCDFVSVLKSNSNAKSSPGKNANVCDVGGMASCSLIGVVTNVSTGVMRSLTAPPPPAASATPVIKDSNGSASNTSLVKPVPLQRATILEVACRNFQCDKISGRVSMMKHNVKIRVRERNQSSNKNSANSSAGQESPVFNEGDVLYCRGQLQLHALYDLATKKWQCNGLLVDICRNSRNGDLVKIIEVKKIHTKNELEQEGK